MVKDKVPSFSAKVYYTRLRSASWGFQHRASVSQICKVAIQSSFHMFAKFYQVNVQASCKAGFGVEIF